MKYSLIVPLYNRQDTIRECLDSLLVQEETDYEIIVVDDGSKDNGGKIADEYALKYPNISVIHKENGGLSSARNVGIEQAKGTYILFPDSDDKYKPNLLSYLNQYYGNDLICFGHDVEYQNKIENKTITEEDTDSTKQDLKEILYIIENAGAFNVAWNKAYKKEIFKDLRFKNYMPAEDVIFNCNYYKRCKNVAVLKERLYCYIRKEDVSLATKYNKDLLEIVRLANLEREKLYLTMGDLPKKFNVLYSKKFVGYYFSVVPNIYRKNNGLKRREKYRQVKSIIKDKELKKHLKQGKIGGFNGKTFRFLVKLNNGVVAHFTYSWLFFIRNNFTKLYKKLRRK